MKNETDALNEAIIVLKEKRLMELELLKEQLHTTYDSLKPINLIKNTIQEISDSPEIKSNILGTVIGIGTGFISKKLWVGSSHNPIKRIFGTIINFAVASIVSKHSDSILSKGENLLQGFLKHRKVSKKEFHDNQL